MGLGDLWNDIFGSTNDYKSNVQAASQDYYIDPSWLSNIAQLRQYAENPSSVAAPDLTQNNQTRDQQLALAAQLRDTAAGRGPSVAALQLKQGLQQQLAQQQAAAASARGDVNPFLMQRLAGDQAASAMQSTNAQLAQQRAAEALGAQTSLGGVLSGIRGQDQNMTALQQNTATTNAQLADAAKQFGLSGQLGVTARDQAARIAYAQSLNETALQNSMINANVATGNASGGQSFGKALSGGLGIGIGGLLMSDERLKTNVDRKGVDRDIDDFLSNLDPASYNYKDRAHGEGRHWSVMAQSAAKSRAGKSFVLNTPEGLALDTRKATGVTLSALSHLHRRLSLAEEALKKHG